MRLFRYIFWEISKSSFVAAFVAMLILISMQALRLSKKVIKLDLDFLYILKMILGLSLSFLPVILPVAFLIALLGLYGRMSTERETMALFSLGTRPFKLMKPALFSGFFFALLTLFVSLNLGPSGYKLFQSTLNEGLSKKIIDILRPKTYHEDFLDMMIYVDDIDKKKNVFKGVFIHDEKNFPFPVGIQAKEGILQLKDNNKQGQLILIDGKMTSLNLGENQSRVIRFDRYTWDLNFDSRGSNKRLSPATWSYEKIIHDEKVELKKAKPQMKLFWVEKSRRFALSFFCLLIIPFCFSLNLGGGRAAKNRSFFTAILIASVYYFFYSTSVSWVLKSKWSALSQSEYLVWFVVWMPNLIILLLGLFNLWRKTHRPSAV